MDANGFDAAVGGARRDEEKSRAKERIFSFRSRGQVWDPRKQRPELWHLFNTRWDILFGTFYYPRWQEFPATGVVGETGRPSLQGALWGPFIAWWRMAVTRERLLPD
jgi:Phosphoadenosine phosphosulfate reductase family